jgi:hypothetical protein
MLLLVKFRQEYYSSAFILVDVVHGALTASLAQKDHWTYEQYLHTLLNMQLCVGEQKRIERHLKAAKLNVMAVTAIHRLVHHATIISITQQSYRKNKPHQQG